MYYVWHISLLAFSIRSICQSPIFNSLSHSLDPFTVSGLYLLLRNYNAEDGDFRFEFRFALNDDSLPLNNIRGALVFLRFTTSHRHTHTQKKAQTFVSGYTISVKVEIMPGIWLTEIHCLLGLTFRLQTLML